MLSFSGNASGPFWRETAWRVVAFSSSGVASDPSLSSIPFPSSFRVFSRVSRAIFLLFPLRVLSRVCGSNLMADDHPNGFLKFTRDPIGYRDTATRVGDYKEIYAQDWDDAHLREQGSRCMDCGVPTCMAGCPIGNIIPDFNDLVSRGNWRAALDRLHATNNFPEFTGYTCPAPCEPACVLAVNAEPVTIKSIERAIVDRGWAEGWIIPEPPQTRTGKRVAIVGSGPAGLAAAQQLNRVGHEVTVFERDDEIGGLMVYGIPDFKFGKYQVARRVDQMRQEGVIFCAGANVGVNTAVSGVEREI